MVAAESAPSTALLEANRRLHQLREKVQADQASPGITDRPVAADHRASIAGRLAEMATDHRSQPVILPQHLGWESVAVTAVLKGVQGRLSDADGDVRSKGLSRALEATTHEPALTANAQEPAAATVKLYPGIASGMLNKDMAAAGRLWLLLRYLDQAGQGWLRIDLVQEKLANRNSTLRLCGQRQLRNLLKQGRGIFWDQDKKRVWLKSATKAAEALGVERLTGRPVELPVKVLLGGIGQVRAHFYASFHSGRRSGNPISRAKLEQLTSVPERTQRIYDEVAGVDSRKNIVIGARHTEKEVQEQAWQHGRAVFEFIDAKGRQGPVGQRYVAWQLPNSYEGCHAQSPKGRQKKINQQIDLVNIGAQGNDLDRDTSRQKVDRIFHTTGLEAGKTYNRSGGLEAYWPASRSRRGGVLAQLWHVLPARTCS